MAPQPNQLYNLYANPTPNPSSINAGALVHHVLNALGINPGAMLMNAATVGNSMLPPQAGIQPHGRIDPNGIPMVGPGGGAMHAAYWMNRPAEGVMRHLLPFADPVLEHSINAAPNAETALARGIQTAGGWPHMNVHNPQAFMDIMRTLGPHGFENTGVPLTHSAFPVTRAAEEAKIAQRVGGGSPAPDIAMIRAFLQQAAKAHFRN